MASAAAADAAVLAMTAAADQLQKRNHSSQPDPQHEMEGGWAVVWLGQNVEFEEPYDSLEGIVPQGARLFL